MKVETIMAEQQLRAPDLCYCQRNPIDANAQLILKCLLNPICVNSQHPKESLGSHPFRAEHEHLTSSALPEVAVY